MNWQPSYPVHSLNPFFFRSILVSAALSPTKPCSWLADSRIFIVYVQIILTNSYLYSMLELHCNFLQIHYWLSFCILYTLFYFPCCKLSISTPSSSLYFFSQPHFLSCPTFWLTKHDWSNNLIIFCDFCPLQYSKIKS